MYAVIFTAELNELDNDYYEAANRMRDLAINDFGCISLTSVTEDNKEITVSYWHEKEQIAAWKNNSEHIAAQQKGKENWYKHYRVEIVEVLRQYKS